MPTLSQARRLQATRPNRSTIGAAIPAYWDAHRPADCPAWTDLTSLQRIEVVSSVLRAWRAS